MASIDNGQSWIALPDVSPQNYYTTYTHLENSFRDAQGYLHRDVIRMNLAKVFCGWEILSGEQIALLQSLYSYNYFYLRFVDNFNNFVIKKVYAGPLEGKVAKLDSISCRIKWHTSVQMNFIEY